MSELNSLKNSLQSIVDKTKPTRVNAFLEWDWIKSGLVTAGGVIGGGLAGYFSFGLGAPAGAAAGAAATAAILSIGEEIKQEYTKSEWTNGGRVPYVNFFINFNANVWIEYLNSEEGSEDIGIRENLKVTIEAWQNYFLDQFKGIRFLGEDLNEVITKENIEKSGFIANYSIDELLYFQENLSS